MHSNEMLGFVGVGVMGRPMAERLMARGHALMVYDASARAREQLSAVGAQVAASAQEVADNASVLFTSLPSPAIFQDVALGEHGISRGKAVKILVDLSTVGSRATRAVAAGLGRHDIEVVDAPVSGGAAGAKAGTLSVMAAGKPEAIAAVRTLLEIFGKIIVVGEQPGQGQLIKLLNNMLSSTAFAITSEAFVAGVRGGLDPETMMSVFNAGSGKNGATMDKFPKYVLPRSFDFGFPISSVCKDIGLAVDECQAMGVPLWVGNTVRQLWQFAALQDGRGCDMTELVKYVEQWSDAADQA
ncbi:NAD(P)-dependent oxidoreductase [Castellaniella sp. GW247-6E4]|uniref:NAD(P)-dependent oxidoreductase n=1 Tax=Castellaniella sp. GW247-6E4 TaxID=3140380 RepID=UPI003315433F